jgi:hypothetical protein
MIDFDLFIFAWSAPILVRSDFGLLHYLVTVLAARFYLLLARYDAIHGSTHVIEWRTL